MNFVFRRSPYSRRVLNPLKVWAWEMNIGRVLKLDLPEKDSISVRSVCRNTQVPATYFPSKENISLFSSLGENLSRFENI